MHGRIRKIVGLLFSLFLLGLTIILWLQRQAIYDWLQLRNYQPSAAIVSITNETTMTPAARRMFYVNHPSLENKARFNDVCTEQLKVSEHTNILGCYIGGQQGIYIFDVQDERLDGVEEVAAAHEMLHAAYDRLSGKERDTIDAKVMAFYNGHVTDERIRKNIANYQEADDSIPNELHSILATEVRVLNPELEAYYERYFTDRSRVVSFKEQYEEVFNKLQAKIEAYDTQLSDYVTHLTELKKTIEAEGNYLDHEADRLQDLESSGNIAAYNAGVPSYNKKLQQYREHVAEYNRIVDDYKTTLEKRNDAAFISRDLNESISSEIKPAADDSL